MKGTFRTLVLAGLFAAAIAGGAQAQAPAQAPLALDEAVRQALANSPVMAQHRYALDAAAAQTAEQRATGRPVLTFSTNVATGTSPSQLPVYIDDERVGYGRMGSTSTMVAQLQFSHPLYDFGKTRHSVSAAAYGEQAQQAAFDRTADALVVQVKAAYYRALYHTRLDSLYGQIVPMSEALAKISRERAANGAALAPEVLRAQVDVQNARVQQAAAQNEARKSLDELARLLGRDRVDFTLAGSLPALPPLGDAQRFYEPILQRALANRQDLDALDYQRQAQDELARAAEALTRPTLALQSSAAYYGPKSVFGVDEPGVKTYNWRVGLSFSYNLFEGGRAGARRAQAVAAANQLDAERESLRQQIATDVRTALSDLANLQAVLEAGAALAEQAETNLRLVETTYREGAVPLVTYTEALVAAASATASLEESRFQVAQALLHLESITGTEVAFTTDATF